MYRLFNMRRKKINFKVILICIFSITLLSLSMAYSILKQNIKIIGKANLIPQTPEQEGYEVTYEINNKWYSNGKYYYEIRMTLHNHTNQQLEGWKIDVQAPTNAEIINYSNVNCKLNGKIIEFTSVSYNAEIAAKEKVSFEFQVSTTDPYYQPSNIVINGNIQVPPDEPEKPEETEKKANIIFWEENNWEVGGEYYEQYQVKVQNIGISEITSWKFDLDLKEEAKIQQIWNALVQNNEGNLFTFSNSAYNGIIEIGGEVTFGFIFSSSNKEVKLEAINIVLQ